jgi:hypothetical protein
MAERKERKKKQKKQKLKLPKKLIVIPNPDKSWHESWHDGRDLLNLPHPWRMVCLGPPNSGKSLVVKNILLRENPPFEKMYIGHCDPCGTNEYDDVNGVMLEEIPPPELWDSKYKTLVVLDDIDFTQMKKEQKKNFDRLLGYVSTHKNISVIICNQDPFAVPAIARRCANFWVLWRCPDLDAMATVARKTGMNSKDFKNIFDSIMPNKHDSLWIDMTDKTPAPLRKNGYEIIEKN